MTLKNYSFSVIPKLPVLWEGGFLLFDLVFELFAIPCIVGTCDVFDCTRFRNENCGSDHKVFDAVFAYEFSCGAVGDTAEHFSKFFQRENVGIIRKLNDVFFSCFFTKSPQKISRQRQMIWCECFDFWKTTSKRPPFSRRIEFFAILARGQTPRTFSGFSPRKVLICGDIRTSLTSVKRIENASYFRSKTIT